MSEYQSPPGSRVDRAQNAAQHATSGSEAHGHASVQEDMSLGLEPVPVTGTVHLEAAEEGIYRTSVVGSSTYRSLLPQDPKRVRAVVMAIDEPVVLCMSKELAQDAANQVTSTPYPTGFYLPISIPLEIKNKGVVYVANTSATQTRVSVMVEHEDPRKHHRSG